MKRSGFFLLCVRPFIHIYLKVETKKIVSDIWEWECGQNDQLGINTT